jgi:hypothetical protein
MTDANEVKQELTPKARKNKKGSGRGDSNANQSGGRRGKDPAGDTATTGDGQQEREEMSEEERERRIRDLQSKVVAPYVASILNQGDIRMAPDAPRLIYQLLPAITAEIGAIRKEQQNSHQKYRYRGIDDALNQISPVLCKHGVCTEVEVTDHHVTNRESGTKTIYHATVSLQIRFIASDGSSVVSRAAGEGMSHGDDKATAKAMSGAMKYALFFGLMVPVDRDELADPDQPGAEPEAVTTAKKLIQQATTKKRVKELLDRVQASDAFTVEQKGTLEFLAESRTGELK